ncbi:hypothetical protein BDM02DRAFT_3130691 [Thelephora ganbajun]|uniref:Uncharacterized protein n=1 Tax=Thelephora ganbajun TaxID=370292 RepID=A0ACB6Z8B9_THEGA|nr:hypothetical protein BDM02DRAFT_3130691 [Thelephora ganbajun]
MGMEASSLELELEITPQMPPPTRTAFSPKSCLVELRKELEKSPVLEYSGVGNPLRGQEIGGAMMVAIRGRGSKERALMGFSTFKHRNLDGGAFGHNAMIHHCEKQNFKFGRYMWLENMTNHPLFDPEVIVVNTAPLIVAFARNMTEPRFPYPKRMTVSGPHGGIQ